MSSTQLPRSARDVTARPTAGQAPADAPAAAGHDPAGAAAAADERLAAARAVIAASAPEVGACVEWVEDFTFAAATTMHVGGRPAAAVRCRSAAAVAAVVGALDAHGVDCLIVGGGSNLVVAEGTLPVVAVVMADEQTTIDPATGIVQAAAGVVWDELVAATVAAGLGGLECLSGIPGTVGATPVQNVGAYGVEIVDVLRRVELYDRQRGVLEWVAPEALELAYRYSNLKFTHRAVVTRVEYTLRTDGQSAPLRFGELARTLGVDPQDTSPRRPVAAVRDAVLGLRRGKGMVHDPDDYDTWSAGSFFTNPIVPAADIDAVKETIAAHLQTVGRAEDFATMPCFDTPAGFKLSAAWLIDRAGFDKGYPGEGAVARLSTKHTLALTNRGNATAADIVALARDIRAGVHAAFGVTLEPEPVWVGVSIDEDE
ncbi:UDP-N-acetylenolpyruvoylglucosamine reductase [Corynebacterium sp. 13CS0277]|uniref:UDP-N-acetylmuramate dehydrogenase n=1 Tax=Corynebacterium sp. 13CS0277 TaxID=2071994 RepID=UPI000D023F11|nr:UDP-N-acetylmuramate dehydrogenase [Corynebacterium sp. 13CS0277]PRQ12208.1 UDP-N-acetylenolpyruvoylglucosamine reductase [Corynebacterium sp. 13CS0277]